MCGTELVRIKERSGAINKGDKMRYFLSAFIALVILCACGGGGSDSEPTPMADAKYDEYLGVTLLGLRSPTFNCEDLKSMLEGVQRPALSFLWKSFGENDQCLDWFLDDPREKTLQVFVINSVCVRKRNCEGPDRGGFENFIQYSREAYLKVDLPSRENLTFIITPGLEDDMWNQDFAELSDFIRADLPGVLIGRNRNDQVISDVDCAGADVCELHNNARAEAFDKVLGYSNDGYDLDLGGEIWSLPNRYSREGVFSRITNGDPREEYLYLWKASFNGLRVDSGDTPPPFRRDILISQTDVVEINKLLNEVQNVFMGKN